MLVKRTDGSDHDFAQLVQESDTFYRQTFGAAMDYFDQFNTIDTIEHAIVINEDDIPVACGCFRPHDEDSAEIKRMYVLPASRNKGFATAVLHELEKWAKELGYSSTVLETSINLTQAVNLYRKHGYQKTEKWGPYTEVEMSICMKKTL
jgi:putative acetyltransferase